VKKAGSKGKMKHIEKSDQLFVEKMMWVIQLTIRPMCMCLDLR